MTGCKCLCHTDINLACDIDNCAAWKLPWDDPARDIAQDMADLIGAPCFGRVPKVLPVEEV